ncbi:hypothetical protein ASPBRDRAFT_49243 [Aspergillus brasiliensis CBS 101740]|uniref:Cyanovirin-N domain-containing protein n=1 Tax=Aspergillus brasiliensis (strain CBS 101740 / IMI 381727 / IBT 21946) TaxID=767769 RepID=A0A1L9U2Z6_ASPBC|nr:hypothetical protein ASPBRDRAFT_49243 [Aspergillus brasiliensis CBS 101740]
MPEDRRFPFFKKLLFLTAVLSPTYAHDATETEISYLRCAGPSVTVPYCLQCTDVCVLECGGDDVQWPYCHCTDEQSCRVTSPSNPQGPRFLGDDGKPFIVNMTSLHIALAEAESEGRKINWAGDAKWYEPTLSENQWLGLCWGFRTAGSGTDLTYKCLNVSP